jgi:hypothetical protein
MSVYDHTDKTKRQEIEHKYQDHKTIENTSFIFAQNRKAVGLFGMEDAGNKTIQNWQIYALFLQFERKLVLFRRWSGRYVGKTFLWP